MFLAVAVTFPFFAYFGVSTSQDTNRHLFIDKAITFSRMLDANVRNLAELDDHERLWDNIQKSTWLNPDILWIDVYKLTDENLLCVISTRIEHLGRTLSLPKFSSAQNDKPFHEILQAGEERHLRVISPIHQGRAIIGYFDIRMTMEELQARESRATSIIVISYIALLAVFCPILFWLLSNNVMTPIRKLTEVVKDLSAGRLDTKADTSSSNELSILSGALNEMATSLSEKNRELAKERRELEEVNAQLKENERVLVDALAAAETANRSKTEFLAAMSHELRTPLNAVIGFSDVLKMETIGEPNEKQAERVDFIKDSGTHLLSIINDILDVSKIEAGKFEPSFEVIDAKRELKNAVQFVDNRADMAGVQIVADLPIELPSLRADPRLFKQIFINILSNAINFTPPKGKVTVSATVKPDDSICFIITDTGCGIEEEYISEIVKPFVQVNGKSQSQGQGTGLGLYLTRMYTELHGGRIEIQSALGEGTSIRVWLPLK